MKSARYRTHQSATGASFRLLVLFIVCAAAMAAPSGSAATITVTSSPDSVGTCPGATCTLRQAVTDAQAGDTISFDASLAGQTISLSTIGDTTYGPSALLINKQITIAGLAGNSGITIARNNAAAAMRLFYVSCSGNLTLRNLTLA